MLHSTFFSELAKVNNHHSKDSSLYILLSNLIQSTLYNSNFKKAEPLETDFGEFGPLIFPFYDFGSIKSLDLFGLDELIIFSFYQQNKYRYKKALDIGGNIGLHSILMAKLGWDVRVFEPDPIHIKILNENLKNNSISNVQVNEYAVFDQEKTLSFTRVKGNTTGSHLSGFKGTPYGDLDTFDVKCLAIQNLIDEVDFIKLDAEGAEYNILMAIPQDKYHQLDIMCEISTDLNRERLFEFFSKLDGVNLFSQKLNWGLCKNLDDLPATHKEGSLFITSKTEFTI